MALTAKDLDSLRKVGFESAVGELLRGQTIEPFEPFGPTDAPPVGLAFGVADGDAAERRMKSLQPQLLPLGYRAFWTALHEDNGLRVGDAVAVLRATDPFAIIDAALPDAGNHDLTTDDIRRHLKGWETVCEPEIVFGASRDWVAVVFHKLPDNMCGFAEDVALFCPDIADFYIGRNKPGAAERREAAQAMCPKLSEDFWRRHDERTRESLGEGPETAELRDLLRKDTLSNVQQLAHQIRERKYLFLWWD